MGAGGRGSIVPRKSGRGWPAFAGALLAGLVLVAGCARPGPDAAGQDDPAPAVTAAVPAARATVAVLPMANEGGSDEDAYFAEGMSAHFVRALAQLPGITVISPESSFRFRDSSELNSVIGERLGATHLLQGSVLRQGETVRIVATLVRAEDGQQAWSQRYERLQDKLFEMQDQVTAGVAQALGVQQGAAAAQDERPRSGNLQAYDALLRGDQAYQVGDVFSARQAVEAYQRAVELDPAYAHAHARLALARIQQATRFPLDPEQAREQGEHARRDAAAALRLAPDSAEAHRANAAWMAGVALDQAGALHETRRALDLSPQDASLLAMLAIQQTAFGRLRDAAESLREALRLNPLSAPTLYSLGGIYLGLADYPQAEHVLGRALEIEPGLPLANAFLAMATFQQGRTADAIGIAEREPVPLWRRYALAMACWAHGERERSEAELQALIRDSGNEAATQIAGVYAQRDDRDAMFHWLGVAKDTGDPGIVEIRYMPFVSRYADDPRFIALARELDLMPEAPAAQE